MLQNLCLFLGFITNVYLSIKIYTSVKRLRN